MSSRKLLAHVCARATESLTDAYRVVQSLQRHLRVQASRERTRLVSRQPGRRARRAERHWPLRRTITPAQLSPCDGVGLELYGPVSLRRHQRGQTATPTPLMRQGPASLAAFFNPCADGLVWDAFDLWHLQQSFHGLRGPLVALLLTGDQIGHRAAAYGNREPFAPFDLAQNLGQPRLGV